MNQFATQELANDFAKAMQRESNELRLPGYRAQLTNSEQEAARSKHSHQEMQIIERVEHATHLHNNIIAGFFTKIWAEIPARPMLLLAVPQKMAESDILGLNTLLRQMADLTINPTLEEASKRVSLAYLAGEYFDNPLAFIPRLSELVKKIQRQELYSPPYTYAECFWLLKLAKWVGIEPENTEYLTTRIIFEVWLNSKPVEELDFRMRISEQKDPLLKPGEGMSNLYRELKKYLAQV